MLPFLAIYLAIIASSCCGATMSESFYNLYTMLPSTLKTRQRRKVPYQNKYKTSHSSSVACSLRGGGSDGDAIDINCNNTIDGDTEISTNTEDNGTTKTSETQHIDLWSGINPVAFASQSHPGYTMEPDEITGVGGWLAHRAALLPKSSNTEPPPCWIRDKVANYVTRYDDEKYATFTSSISQRIKEKQQQQQPKPRILILYGSLRPQSYSRKLAYEFARLLDLLGCDIRIYHPHKLPCKNDPSINEQNNLKVLELRALTLWSHGHVWVSPEVHGTITGIFKNQIDWIPLNTGSIRPTQGRTVCVAQVNGGSQSFNAVNALRILARWMRMPCCTNQSSVPQAWKEFHDDDEYGGGRMKESSYRDRVVDVAEEFVKFTNIMMNPVADMLTDRYSERMEQEREGGKLLTQEEKEKRKEVVPDSSSRS